MYLDSLSWSDNKRLRIGLGRQEFIDNDDTRVTTKRRSVTIPAGNSCSTT